MRSRCYELAKIGNINLKSTASLTFFDIVYNILTRWFDAWCHSFNISFSNDTLGWKNVSFWTISANNPTIFSVIIERL